MNFIAKFFDHERRELKKIVLIADQINNLEDEYSKLSDKKLQNKTEEFKKRLANGETLEDIKVEAFATVREAAFRVNKEKPYYCQLLGGLAIDGGNIAEMKTGEGKTLTSTLPAYLNALSGNGVHIITVNDYLASRDAEWMGNIFRYLGLTVGLNNRELSPKEKKEQYACDILYTTNNELGFDYLRDNMAIRAEDRVQRGLNFAIIDEVDSVLIDEARTPLIISGGSRKNEDLYVSTDRFVKSLKIEKDYIIDETTNSVSLTENGSSMCEKTFNIDNLYDVSNTVLVHHMMMALRANYRMKKDVDYVVQDDKIIIVDQFTGRMMKGRAFSEGLHQAIEAKEGVTVQQETSTLATITFQNLFRMYSKISGMTGTAKTEEEEFRNIYNMYVICIPTNQNVIREDLVDLVYGNKEGKYGAIIKEVEKRHLAGQPVLVGTIAIETSELISSLLTKKKVAHEVLNAKNNLRESEIIKNAGQKGAVTIATNMAGRGTDIKLGEGVKELGGLCIIGTERHDSRRIDNQLRGRAGRQGDPGFSQFYVSLEDDLMIRFGSEKTRNMLASLGFTGEQAIRNGFFSKSIEQAQKRVEGNNFDMRKQILQYDDVMNKQREIMYAKRNEILDSESVHESIIKTFKDYINLTIYSHITSEGTIATDAYEKLIKTFNDNLIKRDKIKLKDIEGKTAGEIDELITTAVINEYELKIDDIPNEVVNEFEKAISLRVVDTHWMEHINVMSHLKEGIGLRGYAQENPLQAYTVEGFDLFDNMLDLIDQNISLFLINSEIRQNIERKEVAKGTAVENNDSDSKRNPVKVNKIGRNDKCPCGSGKKYKQCCGK